MAKNPYDGPLDKEDTDPNLYLPVAFLNTLLRVRLRWLLLRFPLLWPLSRRLLLPHNPRHTILSLGKTVPVE